MRIAIHVDGPVVRGNERQVIRIASGLARRGHEVLVSCRGGGPVEAELRAAGVRTTPVRPRGDLDPWSALRFARLLRRESVDAVLATSWKRASVTLAATRLAGTPRAVFRLGAFQPFGRGLRGWDERLALRHYDAVIANSEGLVEHLARQLPALDPARVRLVRNGIDSPEVTPAPLRAELGLAPADRLVGLVGTELNKRPELLVRALPLMDRRTHAVLIGAVQPADRQRLLGLARELGVGERVHLLGRRADVPAVLAACDLFTLVSRSEGFSLAMLEAMAVGTPVLALEVGGVADALASRQGRRAAGWILDRPVPDALAEAARQVLGEGSGASDRQERVAEGRWRVRHWFDVERMIDGYQNVLEGDG